MDEALRKSLLRELSSRFGENISEKNNIFIVKNAGTAAMPLIPEEIDQIINRVGTASDVRTGQLAYTIQGNNLIMQYAP